MVDISTCALVVTVLKLVIIKVIICATCARAIQMANGKVKQLLPPTSRLISAVKDFFTVWPKKH